ncbi:hypothetical protein HDV02_001404 [Globomyces sp. JEL0801]|nr:hypothetical protein HDV02_001404 [Globomyces sp. JEL0801]
MTDTTKDTNSNSKKVSKYSVQKAFNFKKQPDNHLISKSQTLSEIQKVFSDSQKIAYVGLCYLSIVDFKKNRLNGQIFKKSLASFEKWSTHFMEHLYVYLELVPEERLMIESLAAHGLMPTDLSTGVINDAKKAIQVLEQREQEKMERLNQGLPPMVYDEDDTPLDIRYTILSHLFLLSISDGTYDSRARSMLRIMASQLEVPYLDLMHLETFITNELRLTEDSSEVKHDESVVGERNIVESRNRWLYTGMATVAGGALIGVTAGLAAPFIGAGIGAALTTFGVANGAAAGAFMASTGGIALITGGGMSGKSLMNRTKGIEEFEFKGLAESLKDIAKHREERAQELRKSKKQTQNELKEIKERELQNELNEGLHSLHLKPENDHLQVPKAPSPEPGNGDVLWDIRSAGSSEAPRSEADVRGSSEDSENVLNKWVQKDANKTVESVVGEDAPGKLDITESKVELTEGDSVESDQRRQTHVLITISGLVPYDKDDHTLPFSVLEQGLNGDQYALVWETKVLQEVFSTLSILFGEIASFIFQQGLQATILPALMASLSGPMWLMKLTYLVDNPWGNALTKAEKAGRLLADTIIGQVQSNRPVSLVGYSLGARLIYFCLLELEKKGVYGVIESVYMFGTPCVASKKEWEAISSVVSGRIVNGYCRNDTLLGVLYRTSTVLYKDVPGLGPVQDITGIENVDLSDIVNGHMEYRTKMPSILKEVGFVVTSTEFEDQDGELIKFKAEVEAEKIRLKEQQRLEKEREIEKKKQAKLAEIERKRLAKEAEQEKKRLLHLSELEQQKMAEKPFKAINSTVIAPHEIIGDELAQMAEVEKMMQMYWEPRQLPTTLPPLVIDPNKPGDNASESVEAVGNENGEQVGVDGLADDDEDALSDF